MGAVQEGTEVTLGLAVHLTDLDAGAVAALRELARRIDAGNEKDNVSLPMYLKYCEALGLTPAVRSKQPAAPAANGGSGGSKLAHLRSVHQESGKAKTG